VEESRWYLLVFGPSFVLLPPAAATFSWYDDDDVDNDGSFCECRRRRRRTILYSSRPRAQIGHGWYDAQYEYFRDDDAEITARTRLRLVPGGLLFPVYTMGDKRVCRPRLARIYYDDSNNEEKDVNTESSDPGRGWFSSTTTNNNTSHWAQQQQQQQQESRETETKVIRAASMIVWYSNCVVGFARCCGRRRRRPLLKKKKARQLPQYQRSCASLLTFLFPSAFASFFAGAVPAGGWRCNAASASPLPARCQPAARK
jgi:hypothetical protein